MEFHSVKGLYTGPHGHKGYRRDQSWQNHFPSPDSIINRSAEAHHPLWFPGVSEELAGCGCPSTGAIACSGGWLRPGQVEVLAPGSRGTLPWCHILCTSSSASPVTPGTRVLGESRGSLDTHRAFCCPGDNLWRIPRAAGLAKGFVPCSAETGPGGSV